MSFSANVKQELTQIPLDDSYRCKSELVGFVRTNGKVYIDFQRGLILNFETTGGNIARRIFKSIKTLYNYEPLMTVINDGQLRKKNLYKLSLDDEITRFILEDGGYEADGLGYKIREDFDLVENVKNKDFLRGAFLGGGSVIEPKKSYQLEIVCDTENSMDSIEKIAMDEGIDFKTTSRQDSYILYLKNGDMISDFLSLIGASQSMLEFENVRVMKDVKNQVNRLVNAETANINKTVTAAVRQREAIEKIERTIGLKSLDKGLRDLAILRLANPEDSLKSLGEKLPEPIGKSGVSHRLKKIEDIARTL